MIGVVGQGFVGNAVYQKFKNYFDVLTYDLIKSKSNSDLENLTINSKFIFLCLPTPMNADGSCNISILKKVIDQIDTVVNKLNIVRIIIVKSTIPPGTTQRFNKNYHNLDFIFNPEFLTERNAISDYENQNRIILGGPREITTQLKQIFTKVFPNAHLIKTDSSHAEMIKYLTNTFLSVKVSFANEMYQLCSNLGIDYDKVIEYASIDVRLGKSHWGVPGHDGDYGFGGHCFPKDLAALLYISNKLKTTNNVLNAAQKTNDVVRNNRDWEQMKGRAV